MDEVRVKAAEDVRHDFFLESVQQNFVIDKANARFRQRDTLDKTKEEKKAVFISLLWRHKPFDSTFVISFASVDLFEALAYEKD